MRICASTFSGACTAFGVHLDNSSNVVIEGCAFINCGISVTGSCPNIVVRNCRMHTFHDLNAMSMQQPLIHIKSSALLSSETTVSVEGCEFSVELASRFLTARNVLDCLNTVATPCFVHTAGQCKLDVSGCR